MLLDNFRKHISYRREQEDPRSVVLTRHLRNMNNSEEDDASLKELYRLLEYVSPELLEDSPELLEDSPELLEDSPELLEDSPELLEDSPELLEDSPEKTHQQYSSDLSGNAGHFFEVDSQVASFINVQSDRLQHMPQQLATQQCLRPQQYPDVAYSQLATATNPSGLSFDAINYQVLPTQFPELLYAQTLAPAETASALDKVQSGGYYGAATYVPPVWNAPGYSSPRGLVPGVVPVGSANPQLVHPCGELGSGATDMPNPPQPPVRAQLMPPLFQEQDHQLFQPHGLHHLHSLVSNSIASAAVATEAEAVAEAMTPPAMMGSSREPGDRGTGLADELGLKEDGIQPRDVVKLIGDRLLLMEREPNAACVPERKDSFEDNPDCKRQHAFWAIGGRLNDERSYLGGTMSGRQVTEVCDGSIFVANVSGIRCTCGVTYDDSCKAKRHPYDKIAKYFLVYKHQPPRSCPAKQKNFPVARQGRSEVEEAPVLEGAAPSAKGNKKKQVQLWLPEEPHAVLWHIKPRVFDPAATGRTTKSCSGGQFTAGAAAATVAGANSWLPATVTTAVQAEAGPVERRVVAMQGAAQTTASPLHPKHLSMAVDAKAAKRPRIESSCAALVPFTAAFGQQHLQVQLLQSRLPFQQLLAGSPLGHEVMEPWLGSLQRIRDFLIGCTAFPFAGASSAVPGIFWPSAADFQRLLACIPADHLVQMRCPKTGQGLAHLLVTPPRCLLVEDDPEDPDEGLPEAEALGLIEAVLARLADESGGMQAAQRIWSGMLEIRDERHGKTAVHRAAQYGHRLRILRDGVLQYASRAALLKPTSHIYLCFHSACRSGHEPAARLLVNATTEVMKEMSASPQLQQPLISRLLPAADSSSSSSCALPAAAAAAAAGSGFGGGGSGSGVSSTAAHLEELLNSKIMYSLRNKFFMGRNTAEEGYVSPAGRTGSEVLTRVCEEMRWRQMHGYGYGVPDAAAAAASTSRSSSGQAAPLHQAPPLRSYYNYAPTPSFPSPAPRDKKRVSEMLGYFNCLANILDGTDSRLTRLWQQ